MRANDASRLRLTSALTAAVWLFSSLVVGVELSAYQAQEPARESPENDCCPPESAAEQAGPNETMTYDQAQAFWEFEKAVFHDVDEFWKRQFASWGDNWIPYITFYHVPEREYYNTACGPAGDPIDFDNVKPAFYCAVSDPPSMYLSDGWMKREIYQDFGDKAVAILIAHEYAHHVQHSLDIGTTENDGVLTNKQLELQADCLSGDWGYSAYYAGYITEEDAGDISAAFGRMEDPYGDSHGTRDERESWFWFGLNDGVPAHCDTTDA